MNALGAAAVDASALRAQSRLGHVLRGKWRLDRVLGIGGMATVYEATHRNGKRAAVKLLHPELSADAEIRARFLREGYVANKVGHPAAVSVLDDDAGDGTVFLVMELLDGEPLDARVRRMGGRLPVEEVLSVADQLLDALAAAHANGIVHRDVKPENLFITTDGRVKVLDFGIARIREGSTASNATRSGLSMGTPAFMAPEQARALWNEVDARTDLWAVGATMFSLLAGRHVHEGRTANEVLLAAMTAPAPPLASVAPVVHPAVCALVDRAIAFDREARWPDAPAMQIALRLAYQATKGSPIQTAPRIEVPAIPDGGDAGGTRARTTGGAMSSGDTGMLRGSGQRGARRLSAAIAIGTSATVAVVGVMLRSGEPARPDTSVAGTSATSAASSSPIESSSASAAAAPASVAIAVASSSLAAPSATPAASVAPDGVAVGARPPGARPPKAASAATGAPKSKPDLLEKRR